MLLAQENKNNKVKIRAKQRNFKKLNNYCITPNRALIESTKLMMVKQKIKTNKVLLITNC